MEYYKLIINTLSKNPRTRNQLMNELKIPRSTLYQYIFELKLKELILGINVIKDPNKPGKPFTFYKLKPIRMNEKNEKELLELFKSRIIISILF
jgi:hypothetical protein